MSADRELLESAAKAIGRCLHRNTRDEHGNWGTDTYCTDCGKGTYGEHWNPLTDDGDALRLAVTLKIRLVEFNDTIVKSSAVAWREGAASCSLWEPEGADAYAATRRAIVRAAAEVGKGMMSHDEFVLMFPGRFEQEEVDRATIAEATGAKP